jgi:hypothetical protein
MDLRVKQIIDEHKLYDNSFKEKETTLSLLFGGHKYTQSEAREIWFSGIACGVEIGLNKASLEGQKLELINNTENPKHKEFLEKFYKLASEYQCAIQYHPQFGMTVIDRQ